MNILDITYNNFRVLKRCSIRLNKNITLLIGKNNSGKTSALDGLFMALSGTNLESSKVYPNMKENLNKVENVTDGSISINFKLDSLDLRESQGTSNIQYLADYREILNNVLNVHWRFTNLNKIFINVSVRGTNSGSIRNLDSKKISRSILKILGTKVLYIKADRRIPKYEKLISLKDLNKERFENHARNYVYYLSKRNDYQKFKRDFKSIFPKNLLDPELKPETKMVMLNVENDYTHTSFEIDRMGDGFKNVLLIFSKIWFSNARIVLIDEPELAMHTDLLKKFLNLLNSMDRQIIICSHNENLINSFSDNMIRYVFQDNPISSSIVPLGLSVHNRLLKDLGADTSNFNKSRLIGSKLIIFIEDKPSEEEKIIKLMKKISPEIDIDNLRITFETTQGGGLIKHEFIDKIHGSEFPFILVRDRDEFDDNFIMNAEKKLRDRIHFWDRREIENYWLEYDTILSTIKEKTKKRSLMLLERTKKLDLDTLETKIMQLADKLKTRTMIKHIIKKYRVIEVLRRQEISSFLKDHDNQTIDDITNSYIARADSKVRNIEPYLKAVKRKIKNSWNPKGIFKVCSGKELLKEINKWLNEDFRINISDCDLINNLQTVDNNINGFVNKVKRVYGLDLVPAQQEDLVLELIPKRQISFGGGEISFS